MANYVKLQRKNAISMDELIEQYIRTMKLAAGLNTQIIFRAWDEVSGAGQFTLRKFFRDGVLYITLNSSVIRNQLFFQKADMITRINEVISADPLFVKDDPKVSKVTDIILK